MVDLSIIVPGIRNEFWRVLYDSAVSSVAPYSFEMIFVGPYDLPDNCQNIENIKYIKDFGAPTRATQLGALSGVGEYMTWAPDDGLYSPGSLKEAIDLFKNGSASPIDEVCVRYTESKNRSGGGRPLDYWRAKHHDELAKLPIRDDMMISPSGLMRLDYFKEIGGFDCRYEHINFSTHDLAFRIQNNGGKVVLSPSVILICDWDPKDPLHQVIHNSHYEWDLPFFKEQYGTQAQTNRVYIDINNWKKSAGKWKRFVRLDYQYDLSVVVYGIHLGMWKQIYDSVVAASSRYSFEVIFVGPHDIPTDLQSNPNVKYVKDEGSPTRCLQIGSSKSDGKMLVLTNDTAVFLPDSLNQAIDLLISTRRHKDVVSLRVQGCGLNAEPFPIPWLARITLPRNMLVGDHWMFAPVPLVNHNYFEEIGGYDCFYEYLLYGARDFSMRVQRDGGTVHLSLGPVLERNPAIPLGASNEPVASANHRDTNNFLAMYSDPSVHERTVVSYDNWKKTPTKWG